MPALYQDDDDGNDLSDLGLGKKNDECAVDEENKVNAPVEEDVFRVAEEPAAVVCKVDGATTATAAKSSVVSAENGYDRAIKDYVDFAESKQRTAAKCDEQNSSPLPNRKPKPSAEVKRRMSAPKIEEKVMLLKTRSQSTKDLNAASGEPLPKVDIGKRREIFEKICAEKTSAEVHTAVASVRQLTTVKKKPESTPVASVQLEPKPMLAQLESKPSLSMQLEPTPMPSPPSPVAIQQQQQAPEEISPPASPLPPPPPPSKSNF